MTLPPAVDLLVIGGGPAGLRAAQIASAAGFRTVLAERMPSVGRKFLVAGRGGLNLTHGEPLAQFPERYQTEPQRWARLLAEFPPAALRAWAQDLGIETFIGTSGRVFPVEKKAAPLLRRWVERLRQQGVRFALRHELQTLERIGPGWRAHFETGEAGGAVEARAVVLALGGASWPQTGSDGRWPERLAGLGLAVAAWQPANVGYEVAWPAAFLSTTEGLPLKNVRVRAGEATAAGELLITRYGLEGGALYRVGPALRARLPRELSIDLKPGNSVVELVRRLGAGNAPTLEAALLRWRLSPAAQSLARWLIPPEPRSAEAWAQAIKDLRLPLGAPRPIAEAISSAGGLAWGELDEGLMIARHPGLFAAGEMIDWEAPTGGYLLQGCLATGTCAGRAALAYLQRGNGSRP